MIILEKKDSKIKKTETEEFNLENI